MTTLRVTDVRCVRADDADQERGLLGWISFVVDDVLLVDGVMLRRTGAGDLVLSFPEPTDGRGKRHRPVRPLNDAARLAIEEAVLGALDDVGAVR